jgi:hypothetical protein
MDMNVLNCPFVEHLRDFSTQGKAQKEKFKKVESIFLSWKKKNFQWKILEKEELKCDDNN